MALTEMQMRRLLDTVDTLHTKDEVILCLAASKATRAQRVTAYRMWCSLYGTDVRRPDLSRVTARRPRNNQPRLFESV